MDVRCEKCQTEYELDEARLKPGGVTVKCTNCGHMFKIRKRSGTSSGVPAVQPAVDSARTRQPSRQPTPSAGSRTPSPRADSMFEDSAAAIDDATTVERQWMIRLENGDQKSCRELATLQQWIVAGVVTRESLISRSGKTWKRLGDIGELAQYFEIADEARTSRDERRSSPTPKPPYRDDGARGTMLGMGAQPTAAGGTILPDDEDERRPTGSFTAPRGPITQPPPPPPAGRIPTKTPPFGGNPAMAPTQPARRPLTTPPPPPPKRPPDAGPSEMPNLKGPPTTDRATAGWAHDGAAKVSAAPVPSDSMAGPSGPSGPFVGNLSAIPDEPAFAGRVRVAPPEDSFDTGRIRHDEDDDDEVLPKRRGSSAGLVIVFLVLIVGGGAAFAVWYLVLREPTVAKTFPSDGGAVAATPDAAPIVTPIDAAPRDVPHVIEPPKLSVLDGARGDLARDSELALRTMWDKLAGSDDPATNAARANLGTGLAQALLDRSTVTEKADADKLRKDSKAIVLEAATAAQKAYKATPDEPAANIAMAHVLRLQNKPARDIKRYVDMAKAKGGAWARDAALADALLQKRDGKLADAKTAFAAIDSGDGKLEISNDVRAAFQLALIAVAEAKPADAKPLLDRILAAQPEHAGARALAAKLDIQVSNGDPLPPEDPKTGAKPPGDNPPITGDYDGLVRRGDQVAQTSCVKAIDIYNKALEKKPNGVEALTGLGYCHLDAKNFASAHSRFRTALVISGRYEPALAGMAEAYQQQGRKEDAIAAWRRYLEAYPGSKKALGALERLGAGASGGSAEPPPNQGSGSDQAPTPTPPTPDGAGAGSG